MSKQAKNRSYAKAIGIGLSAALLALWSFSSLNLTKRAPAPATIENPLDEHVGSIHFKAWKQGDEWIGKIYEEDTFSGKEEPAATFDLLPDGILHYHEYGSTFVVGKDDAVLYAYGNTSPSEPVVGKLRNLRNVVKANLPANTL